MIFHQLRSFLHTGTPCWSAVNKSLLGKLRKKTGYTFSNCRKALELHDNDFEKAEKWLQEQAQALGWSKATKLAGRPTAQGLVGVVVDKNIAAIVEVNCETDFVARNKSFQAMVDSVANACLKHASTNHSSQTALSKIGMDSERLKVLSSDDGKPLSDHIALLVGSVGENVSLRRSYCFQVEDGTHLAGFTHPASHSLNKTLLGKYGALVAFNQSSNETRPAEISVEQIGKQLCQHIIGMNPTKIGVVGEDIPSSNIDEEKCMIHQEYLLDPSQTVSQFLADVGVVLLDFTRFECGEEQDIDSHPEQQHKLDVSVEVGG